MGPKPKAPPPPPPPMRKAEPLKTEEPVRAASETSLKRNTGTLIRLKPGELRQQAEATRLGPNPLKTVKGTDNKSSKLEKIKEKVQSNTKWILSAVRKKTAALKDKLSKKKQKADPLVDEIEDFSDTPSPAGFTKTTIDLPGQSTQTKTNISNFDLGESTAVATPEPTKTQVSQTPDSGKTSTQIKEGTESYDIGVVQKETTKAFDPSSLAESGSNPFIPEFEERRKGLPPKKDINFVERRKKSKTGVYIAGGVFCLFIGFLFWMHEGNPKLTKLPAMTKRDFAKINNVFLLPGKAGMQVVLRGNANMSELWFATNNKGRMTYNLEFSSKKNKNVGRKNVSFLSSGEISKGFTSVKKFKFIKGRKIFPGEYIVKVTLKQATDLSVKEKINWQGPVKFTKKKRTLWGKFDSRELSRKLGEISKKEDEKKAKNKGEWSQQAKSLTSLAQKIRDEITAVVQKSNVRLEMSKFKDQYKKEYGVLLNKFTVDNDNIYNLYYEKDKKFAEYFKFLKEQLRSLGGVSIGSIAVLDVKIKALGKRKTQFDKKEKDELAKKIKYDFEKIILAVEAKLKESKS